MQPATGAVALTVASLAWVATALVRSPRAPGKPNQWRSQRARPVAASLGTVTAFGHIHPDFLTASRNRPN
jgi:hypothetical protein